ncbi:hypothetical protein ABC977_17480 [Thioalkalicoccus limnaeus]|uniref:DUF4174 domain-containing protein n=1 Tax=Thioalkalicoccus limnaeus TaxID=120681 RepID=A0ABV4BI35_9GAMM
MNGKTRSAPGLPGWAKTLMTLVLIVCVGALLWAQLPRGAFSTDLSRIGQGTPALVVARDKNYLAGAEVMDLLNRIRPDYKDKVEFLAVHLGHPDGQAFARRFGMVDATVILFSADGTPLAKFAIPQTTAQIRDALDAANIR